MILEVFSNLNDSMILFYDLLSFFLNSYPKSCQGSIFCLLVISKLYLQHSAQPPFSASTSNTCGRCLIKNRGLHDFKMKLVLKRAICSCHSHPSRFAEADLLLPPLNVPHLLSLLSPSPTSTSLVPPWWSWHDISSCASENKQAV